MSARKIAMAFAATLMLTGTGLAGTSAASPRTGLTDVTTTQTPVLDSATRAAGLREECRQHLAEAKSPNGWIKNRFETCRYERKELLLVNNQLLKIGEIHFDYWVIGLANPNGGRSVEYQVAIENINKLSGPREEDWEITTRFKRVDGLNWKVDTPNGESRAGFLPAWRQNPQWTMLYTTPNDYGDGQYGLVRANVVMDLIVYVAGARPYEEFESLRSKFRFDSSKGKVGKHHGSVFTDAKVTLQLSLSKDGEKESARHIDDALHHPERTFPYGGGANIPGETVPLTRMLDENEISKNRLASGKTCKDVWGTEYPATKYNCDEYPFASTYQGAARGNYSARPIDKNDNQQGGGRALNDMYRDSRMLDGDAFYVKINP
ncbi:hypothetical protein JOF53_008575 [Crossiella equi]|uniref:Deoxyribonuclease NucA/NucB domain-containing protein n=1 Tax=Crossiella equi TaxID=130796 RepID=A0ABS5AT18_9PSEU|nr:NucA/NucB deoxyribonuclease domain-containing protein [Crossiella equi]MBP2479703.1 hypothetical protein [Crossiella equi]